MSYVDPTERFSDRVDNYIKYRPSYPNSLIPLLEEKIGLRNDWEVADIGAGPGNLAKMFVAHGNYVYGIEPNNAMYNALIQQMKEYASFSAILASAENTSLEPDSIDLITCGQSFHWFDLKKSRSEFSSILKEDGWVCLVWNTRRKDTEFGEVYEQFLHDYTIDYEQVDHSRLENADFNYFFDTYNKEVLPNIQYFTFEELKGRYLSSSYALTKDDKQYDDMTTALREVFDTYEYNNGIAFEYRTEIIYGKVKT